MIRRPEADYTANIAGSAWLIGLVTWYFGASEALDRTLEPMRLFTAVGILSLVAGVTFQATRAEDCAVGNQATLRLRRGAFGVRWLDSLGCGEPR